MQAPSRILVVDDHFVVRAGLRDILQHEPDLVVVGEASNGHEAVDAYSKLLPNVTILDLRMPVCNGVEAIRLILAKHPDARILVLSSFDGDEDIHSAISAGAMGYLLKHSSGDQITPAVRALLQGKRWIPLEIASVMASR